MKTLDADYTLVKEADFYDAWAMEYISKKYNSGQVTIGYKDFLPGKGSVLPAEGKIAIWNGLLPLSVHH